MIKKITLGALLTVSTMLTYGTELYFALTAQEGENSLNLSLINDAQKNKILKSPIIKSPILRAIDMVHRKSDKCQFHELYFEIFFSEEDDAERTAFIQKAYIENRKVCLVLDNTIIAISPFAGSFDTIGRTKSFVMFQPAHNYKAILELIEKRKISLPSYFRIIETVFKIMPEGYTKERSKEIIIGRVSK